MTISDAIIRKPDWVNASKNRRGNVLRLTGNASWAGQPVINELRLNLRKDDDITRVKFDRMMQASYRIRGTQGRDRIIFGPQAGAITKRLRSVINFGKDDGVRDVFKFSNTVPGKPFNHMQRIQLRNFGQEDVVKLQNIGRTFRWNDLVGIGDGRYAVPGVSTLALEVLA